MLEATDQYPTYAGFIAAAIAVFFFSSNFLPVKKIETGDGMFFQWILCSAIWMTGLIVNIWRQFPPFFPLAMLGGFLWSTGNLMVVPIIKTIGLGQGILIWATTNLLLGWASGRFGWFGINPEVPAKVAMNYGGVALCVLGGIVFCFIKSNAQTTVEDRSINRDIDRENLLTEDDVDPIVDHSITSERLQIIENNETFLDRFSPRAKRVIGITMAAISGVLYGLNFTPVVYIQDRYSNVSQNGLDYVFAHFCGIYLTSTSYFLIYCAWSRNKPSLYPKAVLPGFISGIMWGVADISWFVANAVLSEAVSFPIVTAGPGLLGALWGTVFFKEIRGVRNLSILFVAGAITVAGTVLTGVSKV